VAVFGVQSSAEEKYYILLQCGSAAHSVSYTTGTGDSNMESGWRAPPFSADVRLPSPIPSWRSVKLNTGAPLPSYRGSQSVLRGDSDGFVK